MLKIFASVYLRLCFGIWYNICNIGYVKSFYFMESIFCHFLSASYHTEVAKLTFTYECIVNVILNDVQQHAIL